jgi:hypothetical protein
LDRFTKHTLGIRDEMCHFLEVIDEYKIRVMPLNCSWQSKNKVHA